MSVLTPVAVIVAVVSLFPLLAVAVVRVSAVPAPLSLVAAIALPLPVVVPALLPVMSVPVMAVPPVVISVLGRARPLPRIAVFLLLTLVFFGQGRGWGSWFGTALCVL